jgi:hypothetical protein
MAQFEAFDPEVEVNGETVLSVIDGMGTYKSIGEKILQENGIVNPQPGEWYSQQAWLNAFRTIAEKVGDSTLYEIGKKIPENAQFPPEVDSTEKGLGVIGRRVPHEPSQRPDRKLPVREDRTAEWPDEMRQSVPDGVRPRNHRGNGIALRRRSRHRTRSVQHQSFRRRQHGCLYHPVVGDGVIENGKAHG